jgi:hypothetical protein
MATRVNPYRVARLGIKPNTIEEWLHTFSYTEERHPLHKYITNKEYILSTKIDILKYAILENNINFIKYKKHSIIELLIADMEYNVYNIDHYMSQLYNLCTTDECRYYIDDICNSVKLHNLAYIANSVYRNLL